MLWSDPESFFCVAFPELASILTSPWKATMTRQLSSQAPGPRRQGSSCEHSSSLPPLPLPGIFHFPLFQVSCWGVCGGVVVFNQPRSSSITWKIPEIKNSSVLNGTAFWALGGNLGLSCIALGGHRSSQSSASTLPAFATLSGHMVPDPVTW